VTKKLTIDAAMKTTGGRKGINEDAVNLEYPEDDYLLGSKGTVLSLADGVSSAEAGREASATAVSRFIEEYLKTSDTWSVSQSGEKVLSALNLRLYRQSHKFGTESKGYLCTFSSVVVKGRTAHFFHVGDSRIYLYRTAKNNKPSSFRQVTTDHTARIGDDEFILTRAVGMDNRLNIDYGKVPLEEGDRLLITSDGVHDFIDDDIILELLATNQTAQQLADSFVEQAYEAESDDNISAIVAIIKHLPDECINDYNAKLTRLPFPPHLAVGMKLDGYVVEKELFASSRSQLYLVRDKKTGNQYAMKTPSRNYEEDVSYIDRFIQEEWIGCRLDSPNVVKVIRQQRPRTCLYYLMNIATGVGLDDWMKNNPLPSPKRAIGIVKQIAAGLQAFHDNEAMHQDLKPGNVLIDESDPERGDQIKIVDFGSVYVAGLAEMYSPMEHEGVLGTAAYGDPQYLMGVNSGMQGDLYSLAVISYELFTGKLPYGDKVEGCRSAFDYDRLRYQQAATFNPVIPVWFDRALEKGVALSLEERYRSIPQFIRDLTQPNPEFLKDDPIEEKSTSSLVFWKLLSGFWFVTFLLVIYLFIIS
jgi:serine/threonine protein phosphatase PrpC